MVNTLGPNSNTCDVQLGEFSIAPESRNSNSLVGITELRYINELGDIKTFSVSETSPSTDEFTFIENDTIEYCYSIESFSNSMISEDGLEFIMTMESKPYYPEISAKLSADVLKIHYNDTDNTGVERRLVFRKVIDIKEYPAPLYTTTTTVKEKFFLYSCGSSI